jgi:hypothetical protein
MNDSFGARLRAHRERQRIGLAAIAHSTKISVALFEGLERDDVSRWPTGIFRRAFIRAYAEAVGLDPAPVLSEFLERFPDPTGEPYVPVARSERVGLAANDRLPSDSGPLRLTLADEGTSSASRRIKMLVARSHRAAAAAYDLAIVSAIAASVFAVANRFWTPFAIVTVCYYFGGVLALGNSPGSWMVARSRRGLASRRRHTRLRLQPTARSVHGAANLSHFKPRRYTKAV